MSVNNHSLRDRVLKGGLWVGGGFALAQIIRLGSNLILTRVLFPEAFGLMSVVYVLMAGLALFSDVGINQSIIKSDRGDEQGFLNTAWVTQIFRGILICLVVLFMALNLPKAVNMGWVSDGTVYADPLLPSILFAFAFIALLQGFESTKFALAQRRIQLKQVIQIELLSQLVALAVMVLWAWMDHSVWALVGGTLAAAVVRSLMGHLWLTGPVNKFNWDSECFKEIFHFGKWIFLLSILGFLGLNGDRLILGDILNTSQLGVYFVAYLLNNAVITLYSALMSRVIFPSLSEVIQKSPENLSAVYHRFQKIVDIGLFGIAGFLYIAGEGIVAVLYDDRYHDAGYMLSILSLGLIGARYAVVEFVCISKGQMRYVLASNFIRLLALFSGLLIGYNLSGMNGILVAIAFSSYAAWPISLFYKYKYDLVNWWGELFVGLILFVGAAVGWLFLHLLA